MVTVQLLTLWYFALSRKESANLVIPARLYEHLLMGKYPMFGSLGQFSQWLSEYLPSEQISNPLQGGDGRACLGPRASFCYKG